MIRRVGRVFANVIAKPIKELRGSEMVIYPDSCLTKGTLARKDLIPYLLRKGHMNGGRLVLERF